jgi:hypothetical protein
MAIQTNYAYNGVTIPNCYCRIDSVQGNKSAIIAEVSFQATSSNQAFYSKAFRFTPDMNGENFIKQAYLHLKTLPEFADATDC